MPCAVPSNDLALFQCLLIGTWVNTDELKDEHGKHLSYNVIPLPQKDRQITRPRDPQQPDYGGFILKNFTFTETIRFNGSAKQNDPDHQDPDAVAVVAGAPNRGGSYTQFAHAVFYEQQVRFAEGPEHDNIVHIENGAWLHLGSQPQVLGPYKLNKNGPYVEGQVLRQPPYITIAKQIAVPHGNSVLALGNVDLYDQKDFSDDLSGIQAKTILSGPPVIPDAFAPYPAPADISTIPAEDPYAKHLKAHDDYENPNIAWTLNPNYPLQKALDIIQPKAHIHFHVTTQPVFGGKGSVTNIPFEQRKSRVIEYWADYWLLSKDENAEDTMNFEYLAYTQTILMEMQISTDEGKTYRPYIFPHVTSNTVKKVSGTPAQARDQIQTMLE